MNLRPQGHEAGKLSKLGRTGPWPMTSFAKSIILHYRFVAFSSEYQF
jgi:hypothetical protein